MDLENMLDMNRRKYLSATATIGAVGLAGCSSDDSTDPNDLDHGTRKGPVVDYEKIANTVDDQTVVDIRLRAWFNCRYESPDHYGTQTFDVEVIAGGDVLGSAEWNINFTDCMVEHNKYMSFDLGKEYDEVLVRVTNITGEE